MKNPRWLAAGAGLLIAISAPSAAAQPSYDVNCDQPSANDADQLRGIANGLSFGNAAIHGRAGQRLPPNDRAPFTAVLVADSGTATVVGPRSEVVALVTAHLPSTALERGRIIAKVWMDSAYVGRRDAEGNPETGALQLPAGVSYIAACVPRNAVNGTAIKGVVIPAAGGNITALSGTYYEPAPSGALAVWQSNSGSSVCIGCRGGWCQF